MFDRLHSLFSTSATIFLPPVMTAPFDDFEDSLRKPAESFCKTQSIFFRTTQKFHFNRLLTKVGHVKIRQKDKTTLASIGRR